MSTEQYSNEFERWVELTKIALANKDVYLNLAQIDFV